MGRIVMLVHEENGAFGGSFPDLPGCTTVSRNLDTLVGKAADVVAFHVEGLMDDGVSAPLPRSLSDLRSDPAFRQDAEGAAVVLVDYDPPGRRIRVNISVEEGTLRRIDHAAEAAGESRSGFLVAAAKRRLAASR